jgi:hypothetical protein
MEMHKLSEKEFKTTIRKILKEILTMIWKPTENLKKENIFKNPNKVWNWLIQLLSWKIHKSGSVAELKSRRKNQWIGRQLIWSYPLTGAKRTREWK